MFNLTVEPHPSLACLLFTEIGRPNHDDDIMKAITFVKIKKNFLNFEIGLAQIDVIVVV